MDKESFLLSLKILSLDQLNRFIEQNGKKPRLEEAIIKYNNNTNK